MECPLKDEPTVFSCQSVPGGAWSGVPREVERTGLQSAQPFQLFILNKALQKCMEKEARKAGMDLIFRPLLASTPGQFLIN